MGLEKLFFGDKIDQSTVIHFSLSLDKCYRIQSWLEFIRSKIQLGLYTVFDYCKTAK